jgi:hypothetical protein
MCPVTKVNKDGISDSNSGIESIGPEKPLCDCYKWFLSHVSELVIISIFKIQLVAKKTGTVRIKLTHFYNFSIVLNLLTRDRFNVKIQ